MASVCSHFFWYDPPSSHLWPLTFPLRGICFSALPVALLNKRPHVVIFPFPAQGYINTMMQLAQIPYACGFYITFINTKYIQKKLDRSRSKSVKSHPTDFRFETIPDCLLADHGPTLIIDELSESLINNDPLHFDNLIDKLKNLQPNVPPVTCIISDGVLSFTQKTVRKLRVPRVSFCTPSACGFSSYLFMPLLIENGYIPL